MTEQEAFTKAATGLRTQNYRRSITKLIGCVYRDHANKLKCAIGHLLTDEEAHLIEGRGNIRTALGKFPGQLKSLDGLRPEFLYALQNIHDWGLSPQQMEEDLKRFSVEWKLEFPK